MALKTKVLKKIFITLTFIGINLCIFSQVPEFAPVGAKWWYDVLWDVEYSDSAYAFHSYALIECIGDSVIETQSCRELSISMFDNFGDISSQHTEFVCQDTNIIFRYLDGTFTTLYKFDGSNWFISSEFDLSDTAEVIVDSIEIINIDGFELLQLNISQEDASWIFRGPILEKLGDLGFLFPYSWGFTDTYPQFLNLKCYKDDELGYFLTDSLSCDSVYTTTFPLAINISSSENAISISTLNNILHIATESNNNVTIEIYNLNYQLLINESFFDNAEIDLTNFSSGMLIVKISFNNLSFHYKILKL